MMNAPWKVTHDPLQLVMMERDVSLLEKAAREHGEDIVQAECIDAEKRRILDLGWYGGRYQVLLVEGDWSSPATKIEARDLQTAMSAFRALAV